MKGYTYDDILKALKESDRITKEAAESGLLTKAEGAGYGILLMTTTIQAEQLKQLSSIAESLKKLANPILKVESLSEVCIGCNHLQPNEGEENVELHKAVCEYGMPTPVNGKCIGRKLEPVTPCKNCGESIVEGDSSFIEWCGTDCIIQYAEKLIKEAN